MNFELVSEFKPTGDQPKAISEIVNGFNSGVQAQTLQGVTGSGKTFTMANVINELNRPTLILSHNKTLAAQLYGEFKKFFPNNAVEYFVSYYDYYQPEAFLPVTGTYIEKDLSINDEIEKLRLSATTALLSGRNDVIVVSSVSCIYGMGNPTDFYDNSLSINTGTKISRTQFLKKLVTALYSRNDMEFERGTFRVKGDTVDVYPGYLDFAYRISFWGDEIESIEQIEPQTNQHIQSTNEIKIYPANLFVTSPGSLQKAIINIQDDLIKQVEFFKSEGKELEAKRLLERTEYDMEMMRELGYCSGIENYSRYLDGRAPGTRPYCLLDYFPEDYIMMIDESHVTRPQIKAMYGGDRSRKINLVEYGFRLPAALDNRPLQYDEFQALQNQTLYVSATPADYELEASEGVIIEQIIRPTGLLDPKIEVRPTKNQIDDLLEEIDNRVQKNERILCTTLTKRMAEELSKFIVNLNIKCKYIHSEIDTLERVEILRSLRLGEIDVLVGVNLLREGLDLPEVSLVAILDADKEGFLRSEKSLTQTAGRAARNIDGLVIMYADKITDSMKKTIEETKRRRKIQMNYNKINGLSPKSLAKSKEEILKQTSVVDSVRGKTPKTYSSSLVEEGLAADPVVNYMSKNQLEKAIKQAKRKMEKAAKELDFISAAQYRDEMQALEKKIKKKP
ncbi:MAG: excinuclease ABC subunit B [Flavobacteriales bacterium]|nr:excinuclease ABC subunit B [Flavobacteriales bacterium]|tara:strand:- start:1098 stop:3128 length:2031 start_codon:yes stop_codon:yes gene_type:complete